MSQTISVVGPVYAVNNALIPYLTESNGGGLVSAPMTER